MKLFHINHDSTRLLIFFCGFYTDENSFVEFDNNKSDILFIFDYSDLNNADEISYFDFTPYTEINLIGYSYGVFAANVLYDCLPLINNSVAISGTIYPVDKNFGINPVIYDLMLNSFNEDVIKKFKAKMEINSSGVIKNSKREVENLRSELINIKNYVLNNKIEENFQFDTAILTKKDKIIPFSAQKNYWEKRARIIELDCGHFPFFEFNDFDEILEL